MRMWLLGLVAACGSDPTLEVFVTHPTGVTVATTTVIDYESETLSCEDIEFGKLDANQLAALAVTAETITRSGDVAGGLAGMSRTGHKVIVARGYDDQGGLVAAGCATKDEVTGPEILWITTVIAAVASLRVPTDATDLTVAVTLTDTSGKTIDGRPVSWTVYGPSGSVAVNGGNTTSTGDGVWEPAAPTCTMNGLAKLHPNPPRTVGGYAVQIRPAWALDQPSLYTFLDADFTFTPLSPPPPTTARKYCAVKVQGSTRELVCLDNANTAHAYTVTIAGGKVTGLVPAGTQGSVFAAGNPIAVVAVPSGTDRDVYAVNDRGDLAALFGAPPPVTGAPCGLLGNCTDALVVPPCGSVPGKLLLAWKDGSKLRQLDARGGNPKDVPVTHPVGVTSPGVELDNAGCVTTLVPNGTPILAQLASIHLTDTILTITGITATRLVGCTSGTCMQLDSPLARGAGVGFTDDAEPRMVTTAADATGVVLVEVVLSQTGTPVERARMPSAAIPERVVVGKFDTDTGSDLLWNITTRGTAFEVAYARDVANTNQPLEALAQSAASIDIASLETADLDGNGFDDLIVLAAGGVAIIPVGVDATSPPANTDPICTP